MGDRMKMRKTLKAKMADELNPRQGPEFKYAEQRASLSGKKAEASMATQYIALSKGADIQEKREAALSSEVNTELNFPPNFEELVLGCIDADFCK